MYRLAFLLGLLIAWPVGAAEPPQWIVVTAPAFRQAIEPLVEHRKADGFHVVVVQTSDVLTREEIRSGQSDKLRQRLRELSTHHKGTTSILLVGAIAPGNLQEPERKVLPPALGSISRMKGQPCDNPYGCLDDSRLPIAVVGRFPARTEQEAQAMVAKTIEHERDDRPGVWRQRFTVLAGVPAFNPLVDRLVEGMAMARLDKLSPRWTGRAVYDNESSRFAVPPLLLRTQTRRYLEEGQAFTFYFGHSNATGFYDPRAPFLDRDDWGQLQIKRGRGVFVSFGCNACQLKGFDGEGYGLYAMRNPNGPVAVTGSHGICFAAMCQLASDPLFGEAFQDRLPERLGDCWRIMLAGIAKGPIDDFTFGMLDAADGDPKIPQATQRQEHLEMFVLLGDPALKLPRVPDDVKVEAPAMVKAGETIAVKVQLPDRLKDAKVQVQVDRPRSSLPSDLEAVPKGAERDKVVLANHRKANTFAVTQGEKVNVSGAVTLSLTLPAKLPWPKLFVRVYAATDSAEALGVATLAVSR